MRRTNVRGCGAGAGIWWRSAAARSQLEPDAYGNVEATEVVVGAEAGGRLVTFAVAEGAAVAAGAVVGTIDAAQLGFERDQIVGAAGGTGRASTKCGSRLTRSRRSARGGRAARRGEGAARRARARSSRSRSARTNARSGCSTSRPPPRSSSIRRSATTACSTRSRRRTSRSRRRSARSRRRPTDRGAPRAAADGAAQVAGAEAQVAQVGERIRRTDVPNPIAGTVLITYAKAGEIVQTGQPLYKMANLEAWRCART